MLATDTFGSQWLIICGLSFSGKSTLGNAIAERFGYEEVDVDVTKISLYGQSTKDEDLQSEDWARIYTETDQLIENLLKSGKSVVDASRNFSKTERNIAKDIACKMGVPLITVYVDTPEKIARQRLHDNRHNPTRRDVTDQNFEDLIRAMQPPTLDEHPVIFHYFSDIDGWLLEHAAQLTPRRTNGIPKNTAQKY
jgi:predicted kinase